MSFQEFGRAQVFGAPPEFVGFENYVAILTDPEFWRRSRPVRGLRGRLRRRDDDPRRPGRPADEPPRHGAAHARVGRPAAGLGDAAAVGDDRLGLDLRHAVRRAQLRPDATGSDSTSRATPGSSTRSASSSSPRSSSSGAPCRSSPSPSTRGSTQVPDEVLEAAQLDGASGVKRFLFVVVPVHPRDPRRSCTILQVIWDLRVFTQIYALQSIGGLAERDQHARRLHLPRVARLGRLRRRRRDLASSSSSCSRPSRSSTSVRASRRRRCDHRQPRTQPARSVDAPLADRRATGVRASHAPRSASILTGIAGRHRLRRVGVPRLLDGQHVLPAERAGARVGAPLLARQLHARELHDRDRAATPGRRSCPALGNSLAVTLLTVVVALVFAFLAALAVTRFRFRSRRRLHHRDPHRPDDPGRGDDHLDLPADRRLAPAQHAARAVGASTSRPFSRSRSGRCADSSTACRPTSKRPP